jgi:sec-independent protein translocase protein TatA
MCYIGVPELLIILAIILIIFGPKRIGDLGAALGRGIRAFRGGLHDQDIQASHQTETEQHD